MCAVRGVGLAFALYSRHRHAMTQRGLFRTHHLQQGVSAAQVWCAHLRQAFYVTHPHTPTVDAGMLLRVYIVRAKCQTLVCVVVVQSIVHRRRDFTAMLRMICALARPFCLVRTVRATSPTKSNSDACAGDHSVTTRLECSVTSL